MERCYLKKKSLFFFSKNNLAKTETFYQKHGRKTIILARFIPVIRTFAPFVAGIGKMDYTRFLSYNVAGGAGWVLLLCIAGFYFGNLSLIRDNFSLVLTAIIIVSLMPAVIAGLKVSLSKKRKH